MNDANNSLGELIGALNRIKNFKISEHGNKYVNNHINDVKKNWKQFHQTIASYIPYLIDFSNGKTKLIQEVDKQYHVALDNVSHLDEDIKKQAKESLDLLIKTQNQIEVLSTQLKNKNDSQIKANKEYIDEATEKNLQVLKDLAEEYRSGIVKKISDNFEHYYGDEVIRLNNSVKIWIAVTSFMAFITLLVCAYFASGFGGLSFTTIVINEQTFSTATIFDKPAINNYPWQLALPKTAFIAVLIGMTIWCGKVTRALMHQRTINRHREVSMKTLETFYTSAIDQSAKDTVLIEASKAAFGNVPTGFIGNHDNQGGNSEMQIMNFTREMSKSTT